MSDHASFWSEDRWTRAYGYRPPLGFPNPYTLGYHVAQDIGGLYWTVGVPVLRDGVVVGTGRSAKIGGYVIVRADDGLFDSYTHLHSASFPPLGRRLSAGDGLPRLARSRNPGDGHEYMGSASSGPHLHFGVSTTRTNAFNPVRGADRDPRPIIRAALAQPAGGNSRPVPEEDDMPLNEADKKFIRDAAAAAVKAEAGKAVWGSKDNDSKRSFGGMLNGVWQSVRIGKAGSWHHGKMYAVLLAVQRRVGALELGSAPSEAQLDELADELKASLPVAVAKELAKRLAA